MKIIVSIVDMGYEKKLTDFYKSKGIAFHFQCLGRGTAPSEIMDMLGLGSSEKEIVISLGKAENAESALHELHDGIDALKCRGIVMSIPMNAINSIPATIINDSAKNIETAGGKVKMKKENSLILISVNQGYSDEVMNTAKKAGAYGGTVIRARWTGTDAPEQFYGITLQAEKEIIAILASNESRNSIMESVNAEHGIKTDAQAVICSVAVDKAFKMS